MMFIDDYNVQILNCFCLKSKGVSTEVSYMKKFIMFNYVNNWFSLYGVVSLSVISVLCVATTMLRELHEVACNKKWPSLLCHSWTYPPLRLGFSWYTIYSQNWIVWSYNTHTHTVIYTNTSKCIYFFTFSTLYCFNYLYKNKHCTTNIYFWFITHVKNIYIYIYGFHIKCIIFS